MSSHHIVKDDQEPAVLINSAIENTEHLFQLLEWSPTIIAGTNCIDWLIDLGIKIDLAICLSSESVQVMKDLQFQAPVKILSFESLQHGILLEGINFLTNANYPAVHIVGEIQPELFTILPEQTNMDLIWSNGSWQWVFCKKKEFKKWVTKGSVFKLMSKEVGISGNYREIADKNIQLEEDGTVTFTSKEQFWLGEYIG